MSQVKLNSIGVIIVSYASGDVITDCLDSLIASDFPNLKIAICDNASPDNTVAVIRDWAARTGADFAETSGDATPDAAQVTLIHSPLNSGYAGGVNLGIDFFKQDPNVDLFWVLNPDCIVETGTASAFAKQAKNAPAFSLMGSRVLYLDGDKVIQSDGGNVSLWTGVCKNKNQGLPPEKTPQPDAANLQFISGANMVASRAFIERVGHLHQDYFLYYEEVDWAMRRGDLPLAWCNDARVYHHGGTSIGTGAHNRAASAFANYFNFRNRMMFVARFNKLGLPTAYVYTLLKIIKIYLKDGRKQAVGGWRGLNFLSPPAEVADRIDDRAKPHAFPNLRSQK